VSPPAAVLLLAMGALLLAAALLGAALLAGRRGRLPRALRPLLGAVPDALGDAALLLEPKGTIAAANAAAGRLAGVPPARLSGVSAAAVFGKDLAILQRGTTRGPGAGAIAVASAAGSVRVRAVVARVSARPPLDLAVLRPEPGPVRPPPLPAVAPPPPRRAEGRAEGRADLAAVSAALRTPVCRAATAASMLRLLLPDGVRARDELDRLDAAVRDLEVRLAALASAGASGSDATRAVDVAALVGELLALPGPVRIRAALAPARALADEARLRTALREVLRAAAEALPSGAELVVSVGARGPSAIVELAPAALATDGGVAAIARALLGPEGGRVEVEAVPSLCRVVLPGGASRGAASGVSAAGSFDAAGRGR
jgi:signal transduction histidine kinase